MPFQNVFGRGKQEKLNDNAVKTEDYVIRMKQTWFWWKYYMLYYKYYILYHNITELKTNGQIP